MINTYFDKFVDKIRKKLESWRGSEGVGGQITLIRHVLLSMPASAFGRRVGLFDNGADRL